MQCPKSLKEAVADPMQCSKSLKEAVADPMQCPKLEGSCS